jgi:hypothetical protein
MGRNVTFKEIYLTILTLDITFVTAAKEINDREEIMTQNCNVELHKPPNITVKSTFCQLISTKC